MIFYAEFGGPRTPRCSPSGACGSSRRRCRRRCSSASAGASPCSAGTASVAISTQGTSARGQSRKGPWDHQGKLLMVPRSFPGCSPEAGASTRLVSNRVASEFNHRATQHNHRAKGSDFITHFWMRPPAPARARPQKRHETRVPARPPHGFLWRAGGSAAACQNALPALAARAPQRLLGLAAPNGDLRA